MVIFFGLGKYNSDKLILSCLKRYAQMSRDINLGREICDSDVKCAVISRIGKPHFLNLDLKFSLSHSHGAFALAIADSDVGIDLEYIRQISLKRFSRIAEFSSIEDFFRQWTQFESIAKFTGKGISFIVGGIGKMNAEKEKLAKQGVILTPIPTYDNFVATVAAVPQEIIMVKYNGVFVETK